MNRMRLINGDCLIENEKIESGSVDLILTDLPYGTMNGIDKEYAGYGRKNGDGHMWDFAIDPIKVFNIASRILRKNGKIVLFSQEPYTSQLITHAIPNIPFSYRMMWEKDDFANALLCNKAPVSYFEDILVFRKDCGDNDDNPIREYFKKQRALIKDISYKEINEKCFNSASNGGGMASNILTSDKRGWTFPTEEKYNALKKLGICKKPYSELKAIDDKFKQQYASTFNLWQGNKYKSNILKYKKDYNGYHPTQKPILLLEDLIRTFSNKDDLVVDLTMGSGSTGVACKNTNRNFIGIELDTDYFNIAKERINSTEQSIFSQEH